MTAFHHYWLFTNRYQQEQIHSSSELAQDALIFTLNVLLALSAEYYHFIQFLNELPDCDQLHDGYQ